MSTLLWGLYFSFKAPSWSIPAGDNPLLCEGPCVVVIVSHSSLATEFCLNANICWNVIRMGGRRGSGEKEPNTGKHAGGMFFCNKRSSITAQKECELQASISDWGCEELTEHIQLRTVHKTHSLMWTLIPAALWAGIRIVSLKGGKKNAASRWTMFLRASLTLHTRAMRDTMVLSKKSNSFPASLKKK